MISQEIENSLCINNSVGLGASDLVRYYNDFFRSFVNRQCPERSKILIVGNYIPLYDSTIAALRRQRKHAERAWQYMMARRAVVFRVLACKVDY